MIEEHRKYLLFFTTLYIALIICSAILSRKIVTFWFIETTAAALIFPLWFSLCDIIAEVYGYAVARRIFWCALTTSAIFCILLYIGLRFPSPKNWEHTESYVYIVRYIPRVLESYFAALFIAAFLNTYILTKWKILTKGKLFWLRSFFSSASGQILFSLFATILMFAGTLTFKETLVLTFWSCFFKIIYTAILVFPANIIVCYVKIKEKCDVFDIDTNFNPFVF